MCLLHALVWLRGCGYANDSVLNFCRPRLFSRFDGMCLLALHLEGFLSCQIVPVVLTGLFGNKARAYAGLKVVGF